MARMELRVLICGKPAGTLWQDEEGVMSFRYDSGYDGAPLSMSIPLSNRVYLQKEIRPFLFGLLPDSDSQRAAIAREYDVRPNNPVAMLSHIGLDCPGGVQFCEPGQEEAALAREGEYRELSEHEIALKLKAIRSDLRASWMGRAESWSLGGNQGKFALALRDGKWCECHGSAPTTHIFKNGVAGFELEALNEFICMKTAELCGVSAARVAYQLFEDEPALIVERFDRLTDEGGVVHRLHQEDLCQALGVMPLQKYTADGGPTTADVLGVLKKTSSNAMNVALFTEMLFFNCLIGAPDAHAKNYSLVINGRGDAMLSRLYDAASGLAYEEMRRHGRMAMPIGGENRYGKIGRGAIERYEAAADFEGLGLQREGCLELMERLANEVPRAMAEAFDLSADISGANELRSHLEEAVALNCAGILSRL